MPVSTPPASSGSTVSSSASGVRGRCSRTEPESTEGRSLKRVPLPRNSRKVQSVGLAHQKSRLTQRHTPRSHVQDRARTQRLAVFPKCSLPPRKLRFPHNPVIEDRLHPELHSPR